MKYNKIWLLVLLVILVSCNKFLDVTPKNVISMNDMESIKKSLAGYLYNVKERGGANSLPWTPFEGVEATIVNYTDEWDLSHWGDKELTDDVIGRLDWKDEGTASRWNTLYTGIGFMNLLLNESSTAEGSEQLRDIVRGEVFMHRAYNFLKLVQYFSPYKNNDLGVPLSIETYKDFFQVSLKRGKQIEVYHQIIKDLDEAAACLKRTPPSPGYNILYSEDILYRLYARVYHYKAASGAAEQDDWKNAALFAGKATANRILESNPAKLKDVFDCAKVALTNDPESGFRLRYNIYGLYNIYHADKQPSVSYYTQLYGNNDIRKTMFYSETTPLPSLSITVNKYNYLGVNEQSIYVSPLFRLAEAFLIKAEALAMSDDLNGAIDALTTFKKARYTGVIDVPATKNELLQEVYKERKREFVFEGDMRWLDMKRMGESYERTVGGRTFKLEKDDWRYTFMIPYAEIENNKEISQNPGWL
ncbi:RagB/SusD family nutrient uptake outer membrane protein [Pedobacter hiemivivus]|uniref:RagB/SusD family nutrient uptake outer membrane protein n=1 Tax=Pedobacter hiemivivus TaxID=2530454 RepID=A0A4U1GU12_9SPHI|nr:RagB/SusD family nutrient uptake outer membrane protein [Pedobacter hiemivivus]TKC65432.1 RagB/SusD family nutrient uptake outer membrane protein [Pedobacter hiemivivus]